uniref:BAG family molecular chaperone regulator 2 n=1 Tax=Syphacia muris TaxID=451379 RepID=A0A0N5AV35_9BILA
MLSSNVYKTFPTRATAQTRPFEVVNGTNDDKPMSNTNGSRVVPVQLLRKTSIEDLNEQMIGMLDEVERRVEQLRESAGQLEQEKESLLDMLSNVNLNAELLRLGQGDREDINATTNRLLTRCRAVEVVVNTPRNVEQTKALNNVTSLIDSAINKMQEDLTNSKEVLQTVQRYLNACSPDQPDGPIDQRFQTQVIECTADDQKKIRRRLAHLITVIERAQRTCMPSF